MTDDRAGTAPERHLTLDAVRGVAVLGILAMNIVSFAMPEAAYLNPATYGGTSPLDLAVWAFNFVLVDGKMRGFFSLLFGASLLLVIDGAEAKGERGLALHYRRMLWLAVFGLLHFALIWFGDILFLYAVIGCVAVLFRRNEAGSLIKWGVMFLVINAFLYLVIALALLALQYAAGQPGADAELVRTYRETAPALGGGPVGDDLRVYRGGYAGILELRTGRAWLPLVGVVAVGLETLGLMLLGMALLKNGFLLGRWEPARLRRVALRGYAVGLPVMAALAAWCVARGFDTTTVFASATGFATVVRPALILAHAALALLLIGRFVRSAAVARLAAAGRAAFTNYLGTSIVMTTVFYGYGLGLYGEVARASLVLFVLAAWGVMLLWSKPWLERYRYGPLEWLWRSLARGQVAQMRKPLAKVSH